MFRSFLQTRHNAAMSGRSVYVNKLKRQIMQLEDLVCAKHVDHCPFALVNHRHVRSFLDVCFLGLQETLANHLRSLFWSAIWKSLSCRDIADCAIGLVRHFGIKFPINDVFDRCFAHAVKEAVLHWRQFDHPLHFFIDCCTSGSFWRLTHVIIRHLG